MAPADEFYIGYEPELPPAMARRLRTVVASCVLVLVVVAVVVVRASRPLAGGSFAYGHLQQWTGYLIDAPAPALIVPTAGGDAWHWLVGPGKHGAGRVLNGITTGWVRITGTQISRGAWRMIELASISRVAAPPAAGPPALLAELAPRDARIRGEIVDSKCFLGVMNPGERIVHRDCAIRCLSGGVPPMIAYHDEAGSPTLAVLVDGRGRQLLDDVRPLVGRPVSAAGRIFQVNGQPVFQLASLTGVTP